MIVTKTFSIGDGKEITIETGKLAKQADGSVVVKSGNTMLLATVCCKKEAAENVDFMPLSVEYQEKYASVGRFPGGFLYGFTDFITCRSITFCCQRTFYLCRACFF